MKSLLLILALAAVPPQDFGSLDAPRPRVHQFIAYSPDDRTILANGRGTVELHFRVEPGYHVNSHTPRSEFLIPTVVEFQPAAGVKFAPFSYPAGQEYSFAFDPKEKLDVYADGFTVKVPVTSSTAGVHTLTGALKYQACDKAACYPPKSLPFTAVFTAQTRPGA